MASTGDAAQTDQQKNDKDNLANTEDDDPDDW
jgi:hypothetical protein